MKRRCVQAATTRNNTHTDSWKKSRASLFKFLAKPSDLYFFPRGWTSLFAPKFLGKLGWFGNSLQGKGASWDVFIFTALPANLVVWLCSALNYRTGAPQSLCSLHLFLLHLPSSVSVGFPANLSVSARQGLSAVTLSPYLPSFVLTNPGQSHLWFTTTASSMLQKRRLCHPTGTSCAAPPARAVSLHAGCSLCSHSPKGSVIDKSNILTTIGLLIDLWLFRSQYLNCLRSGNSEINSNLVLRRKGSIHTIKDIH